MSLEELIKEIEEDEEPKPKNKPKEASVFLSILEVKRNESLIV